MQSLDGDTESIHGGQHGGVCRAGVGVTVGQSAVHGGGRDCEGGGPACCQGYALKVCGPQLAVQGRGSQVVGVASGLGGTEDGGTGRQVVGGQPQQGEEKLGSVSLGLLWC